MWVPQTDEPRDVDTPVNSPLQQLLPIGASLLLHFCLFIIVRELMISPVVDTVEIVTPPASIQISFRPRPVQQETPAGPTSTQDLPEEPVATVPAEIPDEIAVAEMPAPETQPEAAAPAEPPSQAPRLVAPALLDLRDVIRKQAQNDKISRAYNNIDCDERQRRHDLIDCGEQDPGANVSFANAELNDTVTYFADLEAPAAKHSSQPRDASNPDTRAAVARDNLTGNLGAGPLIRSVMGQP